MLGTRGDSIVDVQECVSSQRAKILNSPYRRLVLDVRDGGKGDIMRAERLARASWGGLKSISAIEAVRRTSE